MMMNKRGEVVIGVMLVLALFTAVGIFYGSKHQSYVDSKVTVVTP